MTKAELRKGFLARRIQLTPEEVNHRSQQIADTLFSYFEKSGLLNGTGAVHTFLPIQQHNEIDTWLIIKRFWAEYTGVSISVPVIQSATYRMAHYTLFPTTPLIENKRGIPEPASTNREETDLSRVSTVLVPLLAFDGRGHRVGYGGGYYDRFLADDVPHSRKIGLSLFEPVAIIEPVESTDVPLDMCITPKAIYQFG